jgi:phage repressor protein C with HTH and peptisase S24 domain
MKEMKMKRYEKGDVIFVETEVAVILDGEVHLKSHADKILPPKLMAKYE